MLTAAAAIALVVALAIDVARAGSPTPGALAFAATGIALLLAAAIFPRWPRTDRRPPVSLHEHVPHPHIAHRKEHGPVKVADVRPSGNPVTRFNTRAAVIVTRTVGTMWCAYAFTVLAFYGLPAGLKGGPAGFVQWASSQFIQLVLLPIIIVGSAVLAQASDRMAKRQFDDVEALLHGQDEQAKHLAAQDEKILAILERIDANTALTEQVKAAVAPKAAPKRLATKAERSKEGGAS